MYFVIDCERFIVVRGPFVEYQQAVNVLGICRVKGMTQTVIVKAVAE